MRPGATNSPRKKLTREVLRNNRFVAALFRKRAKELRELQNEKRKWEFDLD
jgi:hypothetical protein